MTRIAPRPLFIDLETLPAGADEWRDHLARTGEDWRQSAPPEALEHSKAPTPPTLGSPPRNWKDPAKIAAKAVELSAKYDAEMAEYQGKVNAAALDWFRGGSLRPSRGRAHCSGWATLKDQGVATGSEGEQLSTLMDIYHTQKITHIIAWNAAFDVGHLFAAAIRSRRPMVAGLLSEPHYRVKAMCKLYAGPTIIDAMDCWPVGSRAPGEGTFSAACELAGIDHSIDNPISGAEVFAAYMDYRDDEIVAHCAADVRDLRELWEMWIEPMLQARDASSRDTLRWVHGNSTRGDA